MSGVIEAALAAHAESGSTSMDSLGNTVMDVDVPEVSSEPSSDGSADSGSPDPAPAADSGSAEAVVPAETPAAAAAVAQDEVDKLLAAEGIQPTSIRGENRIPYSRTKTIITNAQKKWEETHVTPLRTELDGFKSRVTNYEAQEQLADRDPDAFIRTLASVDPRFQKFLTAPESAKEPAKPATPAADADPEPQPDKDPDTGQLFYTPEKWKEVQAWNRRQATRDARAEFEREYGPILQEQKQARDFREAAAANAPIVRSQIDRVNTTYGKDFVTKHQDAIVAALDAAERANKPLTLAEAAAQVLIPLMRTDEAAIRAKVVEELNSRPAKARTGTPASTQVTPVADTQNLSGEALIKSVLDQALPNRNR